jgi:hypothetical protein
LSPEAARQQAARDRKFRWQREGDGGLDEVIRELHILELGKPGAHALLRWLGPVHRLHPDSLILHTRWQAQLFHEVRLPLAHACRDAAQCEASSRGLGGALMRFPLAFAMRRVRCARSFSFPLRLCVRHAQVKLLNPYVTPGWDWTTTAASPPGRPKTMTLVLNVMGGLNDQPGASVWTALYALTEDPSCAMAQAALRCLQAAEKEVFGARCLLPHCTRGSRSAHFGLTRRLLGPWQATWRSNTSCSPTAAWSCRKRRRGCSTAALSAPPWSASWSASWTVRTPRRTWLRACSISSTSAAAPRRGWPQSACRAGCVHARVRLLANATITLIFLAFCPLRLTPPEHTTRAVLNRLLSREQQIVWKAGNPLARPEPHTGKQHTAEELRELTLAVQALTLTTFHLLLTPTWLLSTRAESIPDSIRAQPLTALDHTPPTFERWWKQVAPGAAGAPSDAPAPAQPPAAPDPSMGDNAEDLGNDVFLAVRPEGMEEAAEEAAAAAEEAAKLLDGAFADRAWQVTYPGGTQMRTYMLHEPPAPGLVRFLFSLGCVKGQTTLLEPMGVIFHIDVDDAIRKRVLSGEEGVTIPFPLYSPHAAWYKHWYKDPKLCVLLVFAAALSFGFVVSRTQPCPHMR